MPESPSIWPHLLTGLAGLGGLAALIGVWLNRRRVPAEVRLITAQAEVAAVTREQLAADLSAKTLLSAEARIGELVAEKRELRTELSEARAAVKILEAQLEREAAFRESRGLKLTD